MSSPSGIPSDVSAPLSADISAIGIVVKYGLEVAIPYIRQVASAARNYGLKLSISPETERLAGLGAPVREVREITSTVDVVVSFGGDGTLLSAARHVAADGTILLGVNFGRLGFLTDITAEEVLEAFEAVLKGRANYSTRSLLRASIVRAGKEVFTSQALNEAVLTKSSRERLLLLELSVNGEAAFGVRSDGMIFATPTGSTAYSLSAGGSIVEPSIEAVLVTPICAHSLTSRPLILSPESVLEVHASDGSEVLVHIDGQETETLIKGDVLRITRAPCRVRLVRSPRHSYYEVLRSKLKWALATI